MQFSERALAQHGRGSNFTFQHWEKMLSLLKNLHKVKEKSGCATIPFLSGEIFRKKNDGRR